VPEGDTIFRSARSLSRALVGHDVTRFDTQFAHVSVVHDQSPVTGRVVEAVEARGKHLLIGFSGDLILRTHMRMHGSWHLYRPGERWRQSRLNARIVIETSDSVAVAFDVPDAEFLTRAALDAHRVLSALGPNVLAEAPDLGEAQARLRRDPDLPIAEALLRQDLVAGLGNVYKSELLYTARLHPDTPVRAISPEALATVLRTAVKLMRLNVSESPLATGGTRRNTTGRMNPRERVWVYRRTGKPCLICGTPIRTRRERDSRTTYWCPDCQPDAGERNLRVR
jgi:endonuclease VIII